MPIIFLNTSGSSRSISPISNNSIRGFKGGTALLFFYDLPRFSVDLNFNRLNPLTEKVIYEKVHRVLLKHGKIFDEAMKFYGPIIVLDYGMGERKLKVEISNRLYDNHYEIKNANVFAGIHSAVH